LKSGYLSFCYNKDPGQADQPCILHIPGITIIIRTEKGCSDLLHQHIASSQDYYNYPTSANDVKELLPTFSHGMITTKREQQN